MTNSHAFAGPQLIDRDWAATGRISSISVYSNIRINRLQTWFILYMEQKKTGIHSRVSARNLS